ncbi:MAG: HAD hydrolase-like protein, partial [Methylococcales bacterium]|nr:HAD hydrolase-like protein [Methylococcales bacterium]
STVAVVGDSLRDVQAAMATAAQPILVKTGKGQKTLDNNKGLEHIPAYENLASYVDELLSPDPEEA